MQVLLAGEFDHEDRQAWLQVLGQACPGVAWLDAEQARRQPSQVRAAVVGRLSPGALQGLPGLELIQSLWAGVDALLADASLPAEVPLARMVDPAMSQAMAETALWAVLSLHRRFFDYANLQRHAKWQPMPQRRADELSVGVLGLGAMGAAVATRLAANGYRVHAWASEARTAPEGVTGHFGRDALKPMLAGSDILVNLLPLTYVTRDLLATPLFDKLPRGAALVNLGRGAQLVEGDLLAALDEGQLSHAVLDVFAVEPLPSAHAFWRHPSVTVLPHVAAATDPRSAAQVVARNLEALAAGQPLRHLVDRQRGY